MVEGGHPLGMRTGDPHYHLANTLPYEKPGYRPDPEVTRRRLTGAVTDVTPEILRHREKWLLVQGPNAAVLNRVEPPVNPDDPDDGEYAHQQLSELTAAVIHTPTDMVAEHVCPLPKPNFLQVPGEPTKMYNLPRFDAAWFWYRRSNDRNPDDLAEPLPDTGQSIQKDNLIPTV